MLRKATAGAVAKPWVGVMKRRVFSAVKASKRTPAGVLKIFVNREGYYAVNSLYALGVVCVINSVVKVLY